MDTAWCQQRTKEADKGRVFARCTKGYPHKFAEFTSIQDDGKPIYVRPDNGVTIKTKDAKGRVVSSK